MWAPGRVGSVVVACGLCSCGVWGPGHVRSFVCGMWALSLRRVGSLIEARELSSCGAQA